MNNSIIKYLLSLCMMCSASIVVAQSNGSNSSYSRFGLGTLNERSQGFNRSMGGVAQGIQSGEIVNMQNPASYAAIDSLTFIFDAGMNVGYGHLTDGKNSANARNTSLSYVNAGFRLAKGLGMSFGFVPYSTIGYNFAKQNRVGENPNTQQSITQTATYNGSGGLHQMYVGLGWNPVHKLNIGFNAGFLWGSYNHNVTTAMYEGGSQSNVNSLNAMWTSNVKTYTLDLGVQYAIPLTSSDWMTLGGTVGLGHTIGSDVSMLRYTPTDTTQCTKGRMFDLPYTISAGISFRHKNQLLVAADYTQERWDGCKLPAISMNDGQVDVFASTDQYLTRHRVNAGAEYVADPLSRQFVKRMRFRLGGYYATPQVKVNGQTGPSEMSVSAGVGLPISTGGKSLVNVGAQWMRRAANGTGMIKENYVLVNVGITFNERWFMKWKIN